MPIEFIIYEEQKVFVSYWTDVVLDSEILPAYKALYADKRLGDGYNKLSDLRQAKLADVTGETLQQLSELVADFYKNKNLFLKTAVIAPKDLAFGLARLYEQISVDSPETVMVFRSPIEAVTWLGLEEAFIEEASLLIDD